MRCVILSYESHQSCSIIEQLIDQGCFEPVGFVRSTVVDPRRRGLALVRFLASPKRFLGASWKVVEVVLARAGQMLCRIRRRPVNSLRSTAQRLDVPCIDCSDATDPAFIASVQALQPDLLISVHFNHILKPQLWNVAPLGAINAHGALLPRHRGLFPHLYSLIDGDSRGGVTVHWVDEKLDTGKAIAQKSFAIGPSDSVVTVENKAIPIAVEALVEALKMISEHGAEAVSDPPPTGPSCYHSWPSNKEMRALRKAGRRYLNMEDVKDLLAPRSSR
jgi:methionyl-tRNA formyltransferase